MTTRIEAALWNRCDNPDEDSLMLVACPGRELSDAPRMSYGRDCFFLERYPGETFNELNLGHVNCCRECWHLPYSNFHLDRVSGDE